MHPVEFEHYAIGIRHLWNGVGGIVDFGINVHWMAFRPDGVLGDKTVVIGDNTGIVGITWRNLQRDSGTHWPRSTPWEFSGGKAPSVSQVPQSAKH